MSFKRDLVLIGRAETTNKERWMCSQPTLALDCICISLAVQYTFAGIIFDDADNSSIAIIFGRSSGVVATSGHIFFDINNVDIGNKRFDVSDNMKWARAKMGFARASPILS